MPKDSTIKFKIIKIFVNKQKMTKKIVKYLDKHRNKVIKIITYNLIKNYCEKFFLIL